MNGSHDRLPACCELLECRDPVLAIIFLPTIWWPPHMLGKQMHPLHIDYNEVFACKDVRLTAPSVGGRFPYSCHSVGGWCFIHNF